MKTKLLIILTMVLLIAVGSIAVCYAETPPAETLPTEEIQPEVTPPSEVEPPPKEEKPSKAEEWYIYFKKTVLPSMILAITNLLSSLAIYLPFVIPALKVFKAACDKLHKSNGDVSAVIKINKENEEKILALEGEIANLQNTVIEFNNILAKIDEKITVGFCNDPDMVQKGKAREVCKVDEQGVEVDGGTAE